MKSNKKKFSFSKNFPNNVSHKCVFIPFCFYRFPYNFRDWRFVRFEKKNISPQLSSVFESQNGI